MVKLKLIEAEIVKISLGGARPISNGLFTTSCTLHLLREKRITPQLSRFKLYLHDTYYYVIDSIIKVDILKISKINGPPREGNLRIKKLLVKKRRYQPKYTRVFRKFLKVYSICPICNKKDLNLLNCIRFYNVSKYRHFKQLLIEKMKDSALIKKLNERGDYFGIPCEECFKISRSIQGHRSTIIQIHRFLFTYKKCPVCGSRNHNQYLLSFYHDENQQRLRELLIKGLIPSKRLKNAKITLGIPCCKCFREHFEN